MSAPERQIVALPLDGSGSADITSAQQNYYLSRAAEERGAAASATDPKLAELHRRIQRFFESLASDLNRPRPSIAPGW